MIAGKGGRRFCARQSHAPRAGMLWRSAVIACVLGTAATIVLYPARQTAALAAPARLTAASAPVATPFPGMSAVGALFVTRRGRLHHFCTATVVLSPRENLAITAAHCLLGRRLGPEGNVTFAPGYHDGKFPKGRWTVMSEIVDSNWQKHRDPNDDVAFLVIGKPGVRIQTRTGGETVRTGIRLPRQVQVVGYPNATQEPVTCTAQAGALHLAGYRQMVFDCGGFTDGTSGGPFLINVSHRTGLGDVVGVIGGYQRGGFLPNISYSPRFLRNVAALYRQAIS
jgi:V8-like Glu-specific endopeptidase